LIARFQLKPDGPELARIKWSGFLTDEPIGLTQGTPAQAMECILNKKWKLNPADKDMIVMWHRFIYELKGKKNQIQSALVVKGEDSVRTAMAKTVGLPMGIAAILLLEGKIKLRGVCIPAQPEIYEPVLKVLQDYGVRFEETGS
jgi:saccharopine dehydrogenase (NADP+, L-glutamate forming)